MGERENSRSNKFYRKSIENSPSEKFPIKLMKNLPSKFFSYTFLYKSFSELLF